MVEKKKIIEWVKPTTHVYHKREFMPPKTVEGKKWREEMRREANQRPFLNRREAKVLSAVRKPAPIKQPNVPIYRGGNIQGVATVAKEKIGRSNLKVRVMSQKEYEEMTPKKEKGGKVSHRRYPISLQQAKGGIDNMFNHKKCHKNGMGPMKGFKGSVLNAKGKTLVDAGKYSDKIANKVMFKRK